MAVNVGRVPPDVGSALTQRLRLLTEGLTTLNDGIRELLEAQL